MTSSPIYAKESTRYAMLCYAMLCYAMLYYAILCYAMLCYAILCRYKLGLIVQLLKIEISI